MAYEHLIYRIKSVDSMEEKCRRKGLPVNAHSALVELRDAIGLRIVCRFLHDIKLNIDYIKQIPGCKVIQEKDYISQNLFGETFISLIMLYCCA